MAENVFPYGRSIIEERIRERGFKRTQQNGAGILLLIVYSADKYNAKADYSLVAENALNT